VKRLTAFWQLLRRATGDDAYERYLAHRATCKESEERGPVLDRRAFYLAEQRRKWSGVNRCC
jgi:putative selenoprotein